MSDAISRESGDGIYIFLKVGVTMIQIENTEVHGWEAAIRGMRNPLNSWDKSDSGLREEFDETGTGAYFYHVGDADRALMMKLVRAGSDHSKFMRTIDVTCDITAPLYWWKEFDTYKVGTVRNSCSTMHTIHKKQFELDDFSHDQLCAFDWYDTEGNGCTWNMINQLKAVISSLNWCREKYLKTNDKRYWWQMIQLLPSSYNQRATEHINYAVLRNMYHARKNHKLDEWHSFCEWVESLPESELITKGA
jgi:hypothetical protein